MSYEAKTWATNDIITSAALNHMEQGIANSGGGAFIVTLTFDNGDLISNKTASEIMEAIGTGLVLFRLDEEDFTAVMPCISASRNGTGGYEFCLLADSPSPTTLVADSGSEYPASANNGGGAAPE